MSPDLEAVRRWESAGGTWTVTRRGDGRIEVSLRRCDGGEEASRLVSDELDLLAHVAGRAASDD